MENLTLVIPAKNEKESLPIVLSELKKFNIKILIVLEKNDLDTIDSIKDFHCDILFKNSKDTFSTSAKISLCLFLLTIFILCNPSTIFEYFT